MYKSIIFSGTMERKFLELAVKERIFHIPESHKYLKDRYVFRGHKAKS
jgi:hypothetical protein